MDQTPHAPDVVVRDRAFQWRGNLTNSPTQAVRAVRDYSEEIRRVDVGHVDDRTRDPIKVGRLLRSLARHVATQASSATIGVDTVRADGVLARDTVSEYLSALERLMIVEDQPAWSTHLRFKIAHPRGPKRHFVDPSLAVATRRATPDRLLANLYLVGLLFTSLNDATMLHY